MIKKHPSMNNICSIECWFIFCMRFEMARWAKKCIKSSSNVTVRNISELHDN